MARLRPLPALAYACDAANPGAIPQICPSEPGCARVKEGCVTFENPEFDQITALLRRSHTIAVVGLSPQSHRPSHRVSRAMQRYGYRIIPVNPTIQRWEGLEVARDLDTALGMLAPGERLDIVDVFRRPEHVAGIVDDCLRLRLPALWLQLGVVDVAARRAQTGSVAVVMDR
jgi:predicted CoA-binding protein